LIPSYLRAVPGLAGATVSGDGQVRLILDPVGIAALDAKPTGAIA
jgi:chemotaxis protein histidine kinase CheA